jgi:hypothetical protein
MSRDVCPRMNIKEGPALLREGHPNFPNVDLVSSVNTVTVLRTGYCANPGSTPNRDDILLCDGSQPSLGTTRLHIPSMPVILHQGTARAVFVGPGTRDITSLKLSPVVIHLLFLQQAVGGGGRAMWHEWGRRGTSIGYW